MASRCSSCTRRAASAGVSVLSSNQIVTRDQAWDILCEYTKSESLRRHALAVETCVIAYARKYGEDEAKWSVTALLHDFDWEIHPTLDEHPQKGEAILAERG